MTTLKEIAQETGVSICTVSRVLNGKNREVWPGPAQRAERIRKIARKLGYRVNTSARAIRKGSFHSIAFVRHGTTRFSWYPQELLDGLEDEIAHHGYRLAMERLDEQQLTHPRTLPRFLRELSVDGFVVNIVCRMNDSLIKAFANYDRPTVWTNFRYHQDCVFPDDFGAARELVERLCGLGHRRIAYIAFDSMPGKDEEAQSLHYSVEDRPAGYAQAMEAAGLPSRVAIRPHSGQVLRLDYADSALREIAAWKPTAIIAGNLPEAASLRAVARARGISVPDDLAIATFAPDIEALALSAISAMVLPFRQVGKRAADLLFHKLNHREAQSFPPESVACTWRPAASTGDMPGYIQAAEPAETSGQKTLRTP